MNEIIEPKINVIPNTPDSQNTLAKNIFIAGNANTKLDTLSSCCRCTESVKIVEETKEVDGACLEACNCLIPFCTTFSIPEAFGTLSTDLSDRKIYYYSNVYTVIDTVPCVLSVSPPSGCLDLNVDIYAVRVIGSIPFEINVALNSDGVVVATDTGSVDNFTVPSRSASNILSVPENVNVNQVIGYVTDPAKSPVINGQLIPSGQIQISFTTKGIDCITLEDDPNGGCINCCGNFKITNCPVTDIES